MLTFIFPVSSVKKVYPEDQKNKKTVKMDLATPNSANCTGLEFDTEESAREWRREIQGNFQHRHFEFLSRADWYQQGRSLCIAADESHLCGELLKTICAVFKVSFITPARFTEDIHS